MTLRFRRPRVGKVWEHGAAVDVVVERADDFDRDRARECEISLVGQGAWMRSSKHATLGKISFREGEGEGERELDEGKLTWRVPEDVPSGEYELKASVPNSRPAIETTTRIVISERMKARRTSAGTCEATWDARAIPGDYTAEDGWKLAIDITPVIEEGEDVNAVVSHAFILAAESGLKTHTKDGTRILCDISEAERESRRKTLRLLPNRACDIALCAFGDESDAMADYVTLRGRVDMSQTMMEVCASGHPSQTISSRSVHSADGYYSRSPPIKSIEKKPDGEELKDVTNIDDREAVLKDDLSLGRWAAEESTDGWRQEPGLNVLVVRADDFQPIYECTWDTSGGARRAKEIETQLQSFMKSFFDGGAVDVARKSVPEHFLCITTCGQWSGGTAKISEKISKALQLVLVGILGSDKGDDGVSARIHKALAVPDKPLAIAAVSYGSARDEVHTWVDVSEPKGKAIIKTSLSNSNGAWYPTLIQRGEGEHASDWYIPWRNYAREGWSVLSEDARVQRYSQLIGDIRHMVFDAESGSRVSVYNLVRALVKYASRRSGDKSLVPTVDMLLVEIILSRGALAVVECVNAGAVEYVVDRVLSCVREDATHDKLEVLDKAYIKSLLKLLTVDDFAMYAEGIRRGAADAALRVIHAFWNGSSTFFDSNSREMLSQLAEHMALTDLATVRMVAKDEHSMTAFTAIRSSLTCAAPYSGEISGKVHILDILPANEQDGLIELPTSPRTNDDVSPVMTPAQKILQAYDEIWEGGESPDKDGDKEWTMVETGADQVNQPDNAASSSLQIEEPVMHTPEPIKRTMSGQIESAPEQPLDGIVILCAKGGDWNTHISMIRQAPRLMWRARERGARAVIFTWPQRGLACVPVQPLLSSPNFDNVTNIPSFVMCAESLTRLLQFSDDCTLKIEIPPNGLVGTAEALAKRIGNQLMAACADRPPPMTPSVTPPIAGRFRGRFKHTDAQTLLPREDVSSPRTPSASTGEGFAAALIRRVTFTQSGESKEEPKDEETYVRDAEKDERDFESLRHLSEKVAAPPMDENSHLDAWRSANLEGGVSRWTRAMRLVNALGDHGVPFMKGAYPDTTGADDDRPIRILSLDGGFMRGIGTLVMLERILEATNSWCVGDCFDLVVGTSTGGIIAVGAGLLRMTTDELHELYVKMGDEIFPRKADSSLTHWYNQTTKFYHRGREEARSFETMLRKALREEAEKPLYSITSHPRWYSSTSPPPHVCLVSHLVSRSPATTFLMRSYKHDARGKSHLGHLPGEHRASLLNSIRATTAAPWFLEELRMKKEIGGAGGFARERKSEADNANSRASPNDVEKKQTTEDHRHDHQRAPTNVNAEIRLIDGAIASNNPTAVAVFEARRLFSKSRPLCVVSLGTGAAVPNSRDARLSGFPGWLDNTIHASCDVAQVDATIRHLLGADDAYYRFQPTADVFSCELNDVSPETSSKLKHAAAAYMDTVDAQVRELAEILRIAAAPSPSNRPDGAR